MNEEKKVETMPPQKTWFFSDSTGRVFSTNEKEAFHLLTENSGWRRRDIRMVGVSDGTTYYKTIAGNKSKIAELQVQVTQLKETLDRYIKGHDRLMFDEFLDDTDPKVKRAKALIDKTQAELQPLEDELKNRRENIINTAFEKELEQARGHFENPRDFSVISKAESSKYQGVAENFANAKRRI